MTLGELIDAAIEAHEVFGDIPVMVLDKHSHEDIQLEISVVQFEVEDQHKRTVFAFLPVEKLDLPHGTTVQ